MTGRATTWLVLNKSGTDNAAAIKELLLNCLEQYDGSLDAVIQKDVAHSNALRQY